VATEKGSVAHLSIDKAVLLLEEHMAPTWRLGVREYFVIESVIPEWNCIHTECVSIWLRLCF
jgi:hypothetical protein